MGDRITLSADGDDDVLFDFVGSVLVEDLGVEDRRAMVLAGGAVLGWGVVSEAGASLWSPC